MHTHWLGIEMIYTAFALLWLPLFPWFGSTSLVAGFSGDLRLYSNRRLSQSAILGRQCSSPTRMSSPSIEADALVDKLLVQVGRHAQTPISPDIGTGAIKETIKQLSRNQTSIATLAPNFDDLIGYYNVSYTLTTRPKDNPVGGKWTRKSFAKLWVIRRTLQHILPRRPDGLANAVAQAINVVRLDLFFGLLPVWIVLRGDAVPLSRELESETEVEASNERKHGPQNPPLLPQLSSRAVRAYFDRPRIALGRRWTFSFGPTSSVVLDTPYVDSRVRIGKGGTSGTLFVFSRVGDEDVEAITEWKWLLEQDAIRFVTKRTAAFALGVYGIFSVLGSQVLEGLGRKVAFSNIALSVVGLLWVAMATGGIETTGDTFAPGK